MAKYNIYRWDQIQPQNSENPLPLIYIKPDISLLKFAQNQGYNIAVNIVESDSIYDGKVISGVFDSLVLGPNCVLPEFKNKEYHTIALNSYFYAYPPRKGCVEIIGMDTVEIPATDVVKANNIQTRQDIYNGAGHPIVMEGFVKDFKERYSGQDVGASNKLETHQGASILSISILILVIIAICIFLFVIFRGKKWV
jgi:hypothetical protein